MYAFTSESTVALPEPFLVSNAHCSLAPSIWRRLLMHALVWAVVRAFTKFGIAMAASNPMIATTIMISTSVKPAVLCVLICIANLSVYLFERGVNNANGGLIMIP